MSNADAFVMRNASVTVATVEYHDQCWVARLVPDVPITTQRTLVPDGVIQDVDSPTWTFEITFAQQNKAGGLAKALRDATPGSTLACVLVPDNAGTGSPQATFNVLALPGPFGGTSGQLADNELVLPVVGQPTFGTSS